MGVSPHGLIIKYGRIGIYSRSIFSSAGVSIVIGFPLVQAVRAAAEPAKRQIPENSTPARAAAQVAKSQIPEVGCPPGLQLSSQEAENM